MKYRKSKKAALLLTMIIGAQLVGSKEVLAAKRAVIGKVKKEHRHTQTDETELTPQIAPAGTITSEGIIYKAKVNLVDSIENMLCGVARDLSQEQKITALIERYVPDLKGTTTAEGLKTKMDSLLKVLLKKGDEGMLDKVKDEDTDEVMVMIDDLDGGNILEELRSMSTIFYKKLKEIDTGPEFKRIYEKDSKRGQKVLSKYINTNFKDNIRQGERFIEKVNHIMVHFFSKINNETSIAVIRAGVREIAIHYYEIFMERKELKKRLNQSEFKDKGIEEAGRAEVCARNHSNSTDEEIQRDRARLCILNRISTYKGVDKSKGLYKTINEAKVLSEDDWIEVAIKISNEEEGSEASRRKIVCGIKSRISLGLIDELKIAIGEGREIYSKLEKLVTGEIFKRKRLALEKFGRREKLRRMIRGWIPEISIPMEKVEFSDMDINIEKVRIKHIVDGIKLQSGVQSSTQTEGVFTKRGETWMKGWI